VLVDPLRRRNENESSSVALRAALEIAEPHGEEGLVGTEPEPDLAVVAWLSAEVEGFAATLGSRGLSRDAEEALEQTQECCFVESVLAEVARGLDLGRAVARWSTAHEVKLFAVDSDRAAAAPEAPGTRVPRRRTLRFQHVGLAEGPLGVRPDRSR
jgi:hypothetical protein